MEELKYIVSLFGLPSFTAKQIADWLYKKRVTSIDQMTNLSKVAREKLQLEYQVGRVNYSFVQESVDGTKKYLFPCSTGSNDPRHRQENLVCLFSGRVQDGL